MDNFKKIYNLLLALRQSLPEEKYVGRGYVDQYNSLLARLETVVNFTMNDFKVSESILEYTSGISRPGIGFEGFGKKQCERGLLLMKLDAVLFQFGQGKNNPPMGFQPPEK